MSRLLIPSNISFKISVSRCVSRPAFSEIETRTLEVLADFARGHGLSVWIDEGRNARFSLPEDREAERYVVVGSHVDSVPFGGNYDGLAGVLAGLACLVRARRTGARFARPVHVLAMRGEESAWFGTSYIGSRAALGTLAVDAFSSGTDAIADDATDRIIYDSSTGRVYYDGDGSGVP